MASKLSWVLVMAALLAGTLSDSPVRTPPIVLGGFRVLAADFHVHSFPFSWATTGPANTVLEARRQGLDVIAMTGHNHVWAAKVGRWFSRLTGSPTVLVGEEIVAPSYHLLAVGIENTVSWRQSAADAIDEVHRQGGIAIAAHPLAPFWPAYDARALSKLDAAEVLHPVAYTRPRRYSELQQFYGRAQLAAVGDSDFHGLGPMGLCRTFVFARDDSETSILEALRKRRTVVYDREGNAFGDADLVSLTRQDPRFNPLPPNEPGRLSPLSRAVGLLGILGVFLFSGARERKLKEAQPQAE